SYFPFHLSTACHGVSEKTLAGGPCRLHRLIAMNDGLEFVQDEPIPPPALYFFPHDGKGLFLGKSLTVGAVRGKRVIHVRDLKNARGEWNLRSEEHTSELQSRGHLVCRLLLEKKK